MPVGYQTSPLNKQTLSTLSTPGVQRSAVSPGGGISPTPGGIQSSGTPGSFSTPGTSSYSFPSSSIQPPTSQAPPSMHHQNVSLGGEQQGGGMPPSMSQYADSSNMSTLLRALVGNKDRI